MKTDDDVMVFARFRLPTEADFLVRQMESEAGYLAIQAIREKEAQEIRNAAPTHQGLTPRTLKEAFPLESEPVLYLDNSLFAKCLRAFDRLLSRN
jgi:hypothetical protein